MVKKYRVLDASAFIGGFIPNDNLNYTVPEITNEVKDLKSKILLDQCINEGKITIESPDNEYIIELEDIIKNSGDDLRLSFQDKQLLALAIEIHDKKGEVCLYTDDYSIQNVLKIINIPFSSVLTEGIHEVYKWVKTCEGCKKEYPSDYPEDICEICGSKIFKRRLKN